MPETIENGRVRLAMPYWSWRAETAGTRSN
jgi:hypothetical protein